VASRPVVAANAQRERVADFFAVARVAQTLVTRGVARAGRPFVASVPVRGRIRPRRLPSPTEARWGAKNLCVQKPKKILDTVPPPTLEGVHRDIFAVHIAVIHR